MRVRTPAFDGLDEPNERKPDLLNLRDTGLQTDPEPILGGQFEDLGFL